MSAYILDKLLELQEKNAYPLHMPGHKRNLDFMPYDFRTMDITETGEVDNLHDPKEIIAEYFGMNINSNEIQENNQAIDYVENIH